MSSFFSEACILTDFASFRVCATKDLKECWVTQINYWSSGMVKCIKFPPFTDSRNCVQVYSSHSSNTTALSSNKDNDHQQPLLLLWRAEVLSFWSFEVVPKHLTHVLHIARQTSFYALTKRLLIYLQLCIFWSKCKWSRIVNI